MAAFHAPRLTGQWYAQAEVRHLKQAMVSRRKAATSGPRMGWQRVLGAGAVSDRELQERVALNLAGHGVATVALVNALARVFHWTRTLGSGGGVATIAELAEREGIAPPHMARVLRMTLLAPDILDGRQGPEVTPARMKEQFSVEWESQAVTFRL